MLAFCVMVVIMIGVRSDGEAMKVDWKTVNLKKLELPDDLESIRNKVSISQKEVDIDGVSIFVQFADPPSSVKDSGKTVLLLHGAAFTSQTWVDKVPTLASLAAMGHTVYAVDLPGFGKSGQGAADKGNFLAKLINKLTDEKVIVISPSMSGSFIVPMLSNEKYRRLVSGWVPVAPVGTSAGRSFFKDVDIPTMIVYGENDRGLGESSRKNLISLPNSTKPQVLPRASHPAYLDKPELWHQLLFNFIDALA